MGIEPNFSPAKIWDKHVVTGPFGWIDHKATAIANLKAVRKNVVDAFDLTNHSKPVAVLMPEGHAIALTPSRAKRVALETLDIAGLPFKIGKNLFDAAVNAAIAGASGHWNKTPWDHLMKKEETPPAAKPSA